LAQGHGRAHFGLFASYMTLAHLLTTGTVRQELADAEEDIVALREELANAVREATEARQAGSAVLGALEAAMAPLMAELAAVRKANRENNAVPAAAAPVADPAQGTLQEPRDLRAEAELVVKHLHVDLQCEQEKVERLQVEQRQRARELGRLQGELAETGDSLAYEQQRVRHYEVCKQLSSDKVSLAGLGPSGVGRRTMEVHSEKRLRETAEQRAGRLSREVTRLTSDIGWQQTTITELSKRLKQLQHSVRDKDGQLAGATKQTSALHAKLRDGMKSLDKADSPAPEKGSGRHVDLMQKGPSKMDTDLAAQLNALIGSSKKMRRPTKTNRSTGRLPQLSF